jgi:hypothetical protein
MRRHLLTALLLLAAVLLLPAAAQARGKDRNHDRIPDRWERAHHLSLKVKQTKKDQDRDGLNNLREFKAATDPRDADTDDDGVEDGDEQAGTIDAINGSTVTIRLLNNTLVTAEKTAGTEVECESADDDGVIAPPPAPTATKADDGEDSGTAGEGERNDGEHNQSGDDDQGEDGCAADAFKVGARVHEAELGASGGVNVWKSIHLIVAPAV